MRYRPLGSAGVAVSAITLRLEDQPRLRGADWRRLIFSALESGINSFEIDGVSSALIEGAAEAFSTVERRLLFIGWRLRGSLDRALKAQAVHDMIDQALDRTGLGHLDLATLDDPDANAFPAETLEQLKALRGARLIRRLGVAGAGDKFDAYVASGQFDAMATPFNLASGWVERNRVRSAVGREMAVIGLDYWPDALREDHKASFLPKPSLWRRKTDPLADVGGYDFLRNTPGWDAQQICLGYALTEPSLASVQVTAASPAEVEALAAIVERDLPTGCAAQIEMARFSAQQQAERSKRRA
ncbi:aldo/keto reductase [Caulobacter sp. BK020]|uniref:aldo/keto reductase n=1 Tax=Caulobacter sp. BK020 TaxID=2512117 RepID=UPI001049C59A|nr:aldo/keto reductase [Caulobacter sp. BK020]TCS16056.1 aryl-alcohol dehydrogenase-like predicted oxidoreductase [Caulobacter sp. BK020]